MAIGKNKTMGGGLTAVLLLGAGMIGGCNRESAPALMAKGVAKLQEEQFDVASVYLEQAAERSPGHAAAWMHLGVAYWKLGQTQDAIRAFETAAPLLEGDERPFEYLGHLFLLESRYEESRAAFQAALLRRNTPAVLCGLGVAETKLADFASAETRFLQALEQDPAYAPAMYDLAALNRLHLGNAALAQNYYGQYLAAAPDGTRAARARAVLANGRPAPAPATASEDRAGAATRARHRALLATVDRAVQRGDVDVAVELLKGAITDEPAFADAAWELARIYDVRIGNRKRATAAYKTFGERFPADGRVREARKRIAALTPPPVVATRTPVPTTTTTTARTLAAPIPTAPAIGTAEAAKRAFNQGLKCYQAKSYDDAVHYYDLAIRVDPGYVKAHYNKGLALNRNGDAQGARQAFLAALRLEPEKTNARYMLGNVCWELKQFNEAREHLQHLLRVDPRYADAHFVLGLIEAEQRNRSAAGKQFRAYLKVAPDGPHAAEVRRWLQQAE